jgi:hypothetical protein
MVSSSGLEQHVQPLLHRWGQTPGDRIEQRVLIGLGRRADQALKPPGGGWLQMMVTAPLKAHIVQVLEICLTW